MSLFSSTSSKRQASPSKKGVAGIPTAFTATFGSGKPIIGILGEFDALPGMSQSAVPYREPAIVDAAREEFDERRGPDLQYEALLGDREPALDYRK